MGPENYEGGTCVRGLFAYRVLGRSDVSFMRRRDAVWCLVGVVGFVWWCVDRWLALSSDVRGDVLVLLLFFGLPALVVVVFLVTVWPTPYRVDHASGHLVRITRLTGRVCILTPDGWTPLERIRDRLP